jgi:hypothetical protein
MRGSGSTIARTAASGQIVATASVKPAKIGREILNIHRVLYCFRYNPHNQDRTELVND